ncbi:MAG: tRNA pseudouridine(38-40) synthase TruA [Nitrospirae bacterium]|nr:tRNA pseudouridine(38-40) synthase TruA [Nitrospirota bacterium]
MRHIKLLLEYDGTNYQGWQSQKSGNTIQDVLCKTIVSVTGHQIRLSGASRTDAGVHALGQVAVFSTDSDLTIDVLKRALNAKLPEDIRVVSIEETDGLFNPRFNAVKKRYIYLINIGRDRSAFLYNYQWQIKTTLDLDAMREAASLLTGEHDFSSLRGSGCSAKTTVRHIYSLEIAALQSMEFMSASMKGDWIRVSVEANAFLRHMVRNIVGTLAEVGKGKLEARDVNAILNARDRTMAGPTAPAAGLFLEKIYY